jgi:hypothetical protein
MITSEFIRGLRSDARLMSEYETFSRDQIDLIANALEALAEMKRTHARMVETEGTDDHCDASYQFFAACCHAFAIVEVEK